MSQVTQRRAGLSHVLLLTTVLGLGCSDSNSALKVQAPVPTPSDPLRDAGVTSCETYGRETCDQGMLSRCAVYDTNQEQFVTPSPLYERVLNYERWLEDYHSPGGITFQRILADYAPGTLPEESWSDPSFFDGYWGLNDGSIWTGATLNAHVLRYGSTGTEADYQRMEAKVRDVLRLFDVTGIPGYLARKFYLQMPAGAPQDDRFVITYEPGDHTHHVMEAPESVEGLSDAFTQGYRDSSGTLWQGQARWHGTPTIDQMSGMTTSLAAAYGVLRDESLKERIAYQMTCYLKRLRRLDIINVQSNPQLVDGIDALLGGAGTTSLLDPDDIVPSDLDQLAFYYLEQPNSLNVDTFDRSCPESVTTQPETVLDAADPNFLLDLLLLVSNLGGKFEEREGGIDHYFVPTARGQDAVHLMNITAMAYYFTGDETYRRFFDDVLIDELQADRSARAFMGITAPKLCRRYYEVHIAVPPLWAFITLLDDSPLKSAMQEVMEYDTWAKDTAFLGNAKFSLMFADGGTPQSTVERQRAADEAMQVLREHGGNDGVLDAPRRSYSVALDERMSSLPSEMSTECPTEEEVAVCEEGVTLFGIPLNREQPRQAPCRNIAGECLMASGECVPAAAATPLPVALRTHSSTVWNRSPFELERDFGEFDGRQQASGVGLTEPYWLARYMGLTPEDDGLVLAWEPAGNCP